MHVVQPYPTTSNPIDSSGSRSPALWRYAVTTFEPGASEVFTHFGGAMPSSTARRAINPAPIMTEGLEVLVQLVIAAITTAPSGGPPFAAPAVRGWPFRYSASAERNDPGASARRTDCSGFF